jgi:filamentous hemagglutinin family protein
LACKIEIDRIPHTQIKNIMLNTKFWLSFLTIGNLILSTQISISQTYQPSDRTPVSDNTLNTQVSGNGNNFNITGGLNKGQTLFHSFTDFSVPTNGQANFTNPAGKRDIITRVTGGVFSDINGLVNTNGANFFLINPNGIVFGTNARLNVGKAFVGSTANSIDLIDGSGRTINFGTNRSGDAALLTVNSDVLFNPSQLVMGGSSPGSRGIENYGILQTNNDSQYIGLIGGNITLDGGKIIAPGGRVDLGGLTSAGTVTIDRNGLVFSNNGLGRSNVLLTNDAGIVVRATGTLDTVNTFFNNVTAPGSSINISANNLDILNSGAISSNTLPAALDAGFETNSGVQTIAAGSINIDATGKVNLNNSNIKNTLRSGAEGNIGGIKIQAGAVDLNNSFVSTAVSGQGNAGNIDIKTTGDINLTNNSSIVSDNISQTAQGNAGDINVTSNGNIKISGADVLSGNSTLSYISSDTYGQGNTGKISLDTQGKLALVNKGNISSVVHSNAVGNGQGISITARELDLANQSYISTNTFQKTPVSNKGNAGDINIKTLGDIQVSGYDASSSNTPAPSYISSDTFGYGDTGKVTIETQGKLSIFNFGSITSNITRSAVGNSKGLKIKARELLVNRNSFIDTASALDSQGNAGDLTIETTGDILISGYDSSSTNPNKSDLAFIRSNTGGQGDAGKITINTQGKLSVLNHAAISSAIETTAIGNSQGISINARELEIANDSAISTNTFQTARVDSKGNAGDIQIQTTGDIKVSGFNPSGVNPDTSDLSQIASSTQGQGNTGKITIDTQGKLFVINNGNINSLVDKNAVGNSKGISITARELELANGSKIEATTFQTERVDGKGNGGDINIKTTGDIQISGYNSLSTNPTYSQIATATFGRGDAGKITIDTQGNLTLVDRGAINGTIGQTAIGNSKGIKINARELELANGSIIATATLQTTKVDGTGNAGDIEVKTTGDITIAGFNSLLNNSNASAGSSFNSSTLGQGNAGKITIDTQGKLSLSDESAIISTVRATANGNGGDISIAARQIELKNKSIITTGTDQITQVNGNGKSGDIILQAKDTISLKNISGISTTSSGTGQTGNVSITAAQLLLNESVLFSNATSVSGGNITVAISDKLLLRNDSFINTSSGSREKNGNGGNITISSPLIIALPGNNDINADANGGNGGNVNITSQGLFGIKYRPLGSDFTSDITASSQFGQSGTVNISTPGTDPGRDTTELPNATTDASNQISQTCSANNRQNKLTVTGRGGLPPNANEPLTSDVVWQDARAAGSQPAVSSTPTPAKLAPPAVGWVFDGKGKVTLIAAGNEGQPTKTSVVCPK